MSIKVKESQKQKKEEKDESFGRNRRIHKRTL